VLSESVPADSQIMRTGSKKSPQQQASQCH